MEKLPQQQEIISLGKKLVKEFTTNESISLSLRWMAHYLAELISKAENEADPIDKEESAKKASELISSIWEQRASLVREARPLGNLESAINVLASLKAEDSNVPYWERMDNLNQKDKWSRFASKLRITSEHIYGILVMSNAGFELLQKEKEWLEFPNLLSVSEKKFIEDFEDLVSDKNFFAGIYFSRKKAVSSASSLEKAFDKMQMLLDQQQKELDALRKKIIGDKPFQKKDTDPLGDYLESMDD